MNRISRATLLVLATFLGTLFFMIMLSTFWWAFADWQNPAEVFLTMLSQDGYRATRMFCSAVAIVIAYAALVVKGL